MNYFPVMLALVPAQWVSPYSSNPCRHPQLNWPGLLMQLCSHVSLISHSSMSGSVQYKVYRQITAMRDHLSWKTIYSWHKVLYFIATEPVTSDHLSWETFLWPMGRSSKTGSTVSPIVYVLMHGMCTIPALWDPSRLAIHAIAVIFST